MPLYYFRIRTGRYSGMSSHGTELTDQDAAWEELTAVCAGKREDTDAIPNPYSSVRRLIIAMV